MPKGEIALICSGKEISFGMGLYHLFQYKDEKDAFVSDLCSGISVEMYSLAAFKHASISKNTEKIFFGSACVQRSETVDIFNKFGMRIIKAKDTLNISADSALLNGAVYKDFVSYANQVREKFIKAETGYFKKVNEKNNRWIPDEFKQLTSKGLFGAKGLMNEKQQQQYDCLAFIAYLYHVRAIEGGDCND